MMKQSADSMPRISIVTPSYQQGGFIGDALESVRCQDYAAVQHVVVDGASDDGTVEVLASSSAEWTSGEDAGQSDALNIGFARSTGDVIGWLNADDFYLEGAFEKVGRWFSAHPEADVLYGDCVFVDRNGRVVRGKEEHPFDVGVLAYYGCYIPTTAAFFSRRLLDRGLLSLSESYHYTMDFELFLRLAKEGAVFDYLPEDLAAFRWHDENKSLESQSRLAERAAVQRVYTPHSSTAVLTLLYHIYRAKHLLLKLRSGALKRQREWLRRRGESLQWWRS